MQLFMPVTRLGLLEWVSEFRFSMRRFSTSRLFTSQFARQALAIFGCLGLLYVVSSVAFLHHHQGPETTCHAT